MGILNITAADAISRHVYDPSANPTTDCSHFNVWHEMNSEDICHYQWKAVSKTFGSYCLQSKSHKYTNMMSQESVFANHSKEDAIYQLKVYTDHSNLTNYALWSTSDQIYRWRQLIEEYDPEIIYIMGIHNTVADAISRLENDPSANPTTDCSHFNVWHEMNSEDISHYQWKAVSKMFGYYCLQSKSHKYTNMMSQESVCKW